MIEAQQRGTDYWGLRGAVRQLDGTMVNALKLRNKGGYLFYIKY